MSSALQKSSKLIVLLSSAKMAMATMISRILGLVREQVIAYYFGATSLTDAFFVAYRIPNLLRDLFAEGAFSSAFVPEFTEAKQKGDEEARSLFWRLFVSLGIVTGLLSSGIFLFANEIVQLFAPSFSEDPEKFLIAVNLVKIMSPFLFFVSLAALYMGALNSFKFFFIPSLAPAIFNITMIFTALILIGIFKGLGVETVYALGIGVTLGGIIQGFFQLPFLMSKGIIFRFSYLNNIFKDPRVQKVFKKLGPGLLGFAATQINLIVNTILATGSGIGAVTWLSFGFRIFQLPVGVLGVSIANSNMIHFSESWKKGEIERATQYLKSSIHLTLLVLIPAMIILGWLSEHAMNLLFERGKFVRLDTLNSAWALKFYLIGLPFYGLYKVFVPVFYTLDQQRVPVIVSIVSIIINIIFCLSLVDEYGFKVLALGTSLSIFINSMLQFFLIRSPLNLNWLALLNLKNLKVILCGLVLFGTMFLISGQVEKYYYLSESILTKFVVLAIAAVIGVSVYGINLILLGERGAVLKLIRRK